MNKARRHEIKMTKFKKRVKNIGASKDNTNLYAYRSHGKPCSCFVCRNEKYKRFELKIRTSEELKLSRYDAYEYLIP